MDWEEYNDSCAETCNNLMQTLPPIKGYVRWEIASIMTVLNCDVETAKTTADAIERFYPLDWSEVSWVDIHDTAIQAMLERSGV